MAPLRYATSETAKRYVKLKPANHLEPPRKIHEMPVVITQASSGETRIVASILQEAADWLRSSGKPMWRADEVTLHRVAPDVCDGLFFLACVSGEAQGTFKFQLTDRRFWPEVMDDDSAFVHRLAVRRAFAGTGLSIAMLDWAVTRASSMGRRFLRLDCDPRRPRLRRIYEECGFELHSETVVGGFRLARYQLILAPHSRGSSCTTGTAKRVEV
jgi:GNAT superfamily N-acetyltransferase